MIGTRVRIETHMIELTPGYARAALVGGMLRGSG